MDQIQLLYNNCRPNPLLCSSDGDKYGGRVEKVMRLKFHSETMALKARSYPGITLIMKIHLSARCAAPVYKHYNENSIVIDCCKNSCPCF